MGACAGLCVGACAGLCVGACAGQCVGVHADGWVCSLYVYCTFAVRLLLF